MPVLPPNPATQSTAGDIIKDALQEIGVLSPGEEISADDALFCMRKLNRLLDSFNARSLMIFNVNFSNYTLQVNHQPHTIGPGGDFDVSVRPVKIVAANLIFNNGNPPVLLPLGIRDDEWWANQRVQQLTSTVPTDLYYSPDFPLGKLNFWPVPTYPYGMQLETWSPFVMVTELTDALSYPQGYWDAIVYTLAVTLAPSFLPPNLPISPILLAAQQKAMAIVQSNNSASPRIDLRGPGNPGTKRNDHFDFRTGGINV